VDRPTEANLGSQRPDIAHQTRIRFGRVIFLDLSLKDIIVCIERMILLSSKIPLNQGKVGLCNQNFPQQYACSEDRERRE